MIHTLRLSCKDIRVFGLSAYISIHFKGLMSFLRLFGNGKKMIGNGKKTS